MRLRLLAAAAVLLASLAACGSGGSESGTGSTTSTTEPDVQNFTQPAELEIEIGGYHTVRYDKQSTLNVLKAKGLEDVSIFTIGTYGTVTAGEWTIYEAFLNLIKFKGDGEYRIEPRAPGTGQEAMSDNVYTVLSRTAADGKPTDAGRFDTLVKPCVATLERNGLEGVLRCDGLSDDQSNVITLTMRWKANGEPTDLMKEAREKAAATSSTTAANTATTAAP